MSEAVDGSLAEPAVYIATQDDQAHAFCMVSHGASNYKSARGGGFVVRGTGLGSYVAMGTAKDGMVISGSELSATSATKA